MGKYTIYIGLLTMMISTMQIEYIAYVEYIHTK